MASWTKERALKELDALIGEIEKLRSQQRFSADHTRWIARTLAFLEEIFGRNSRYYVTFSSLTWSETGTVIIGGPGDPEGSFNPQAAIEKRHQRMYLKQLESARGLLQASSDHLKRVDDIDSVYQGKDTAPESSAILKIIYIADHKLRKAIRKKPEREEEIQNAFEDLLIGADIPYSKAKERIEYSSTTYIPDFVVEKINLAIDIKLCAKKSREREIIEEINDDILAYKTKFGNVLFVVYDLGFIRDIDRFKDEFEKNENVVVRVVKH